MALQQVDLPIFNDTFYSYSVSLEGNRYTLTFLFLERLGQWVLTLQDSEGSVLVRNERLTPETLLFFDYKLPGLSGGFYFQPNTQTAFQDEDNIITRPKEFYKLFYVFDDGE
jgi:hypothetical protein